MTFSSRDPRALGTHSLPRSNSLAARGPAGARHPTRFRGTPLAARALRRRVLLHRLRHPFGGDVLAEVGGDRGEPALLLEEAGLLRQRLRGGTVRPAPQPRGGGLLLQARETVERHGVGNILGLGTRPLRD